jgi:eukaryotic-like serine/threonine-protein kinase
VWDRARATAVATAFARSGRSYAATTAARTSAVLDRYVDRWRAARLDVCRAGQRGEAPPADVAARIACLDDARRKARARVDVFVGAPVGMIVDGADQIAADLDPPAACTRALAADTGGGSPARLARLEVARIWLRAGDGARVLEIARAVEAEARAAGDVDAAGIAAFQVGAVLADRDDPAADAELTAAVRDTTTAHRWGFAGYSYAALIGVRARRGDTAGLEVLVGQAATALTHVPDIDVRWSIELAFATADLARRRLEEADRDCRIAIADATAAFGPRAAEVAEALAICSDADLARGNNQAALDALTRAVDILVAERGAAHPTTANARHALAIAHRRLGHLEEARRQYEAALAIRLAVYGPGSPHVADSLNSLAVVLDDLGDHAAALATARRALTATEQAFGPASRRAAGAHMLIAQKAATAGDRATARTEADRAFALFRADRHDPDVELAYAQLQWSMIALAEGDDQDAAQSAHAAAEVLVAVGDGAERYARQVEGQAALDRGHAADAIAPLERAHTLARPADTAPEELAAIELALGQALWRSGRDRVRGHDLATSARRRLRELGSDAPVLHEIEAWLAHPR